MIPRVSVVVPHFDQAAALRECLESIERQTVPRECYQVIVADNGTPGGIEALRRTFPAVEFTEAAERGAAHARNAGLELARGEAVAFIDADCVAAPDWLERGLEGLKCAALCGGRIDVIAREELRLSPVEAFEKIFAFRQRQYVERKRFAATANLFARRPAAQAIGPFTNGLSEDVDWCRRAEALGFRLAFNDKSMVSHPARRDWSELIRKWERIIAERWAGFGGEGAPRNFRWALLAGATAMSAAPHLVRVLLSAEVTSPRDKWAAAGVLARLRWWRARRMASLLWSR